MRRKKRDALYSRKLWDEDPLAIPLKQSRKRALVLVTVVFFCFVVVFIRLVDLMVLDHARLSERAEHQYSREKTIRPQRGVILDRKNREMAANIETESLYAVPSRIEDTRQLTRALAPLTKVSSKRLNMSLLSRHRRDFMWIERKMDLDTAREVEKLLKKMKYKSIGFLPETKRYYPKGNTAAHLLGFTDIDNTGIAGLEMAYNKYLQGHATNVSVGTDARGNRLASYVKDAVPGNNLVLTIDEGIQHIVEQELGIAIKKCRARAATAIMMNPMTGEILAMANLPTYNPNAAGKSMLGARRNRAITDLYEPGSTLKAVLASAAIEENIVHLYDEYDVSDGYIVVGGKKIRDVHKSGVLTFQEIVQKSSNVGAVKVGLKMGPEIYFRYIKAFGFGTKTGIDFPGEVRGILRDPSRWSGTSLAALSIGQEIGVTPLQVLRAYAAIANGGFMVKPYMVSEIVSADGKIIKRMTPQISSRVISGKSAAKVRDILKTVVEEGGTATRAYVRGNLVAGKTGTSQVYDTKHRRYSRKKFIGSFVGFVPADNPRVALIVVMYEPKGMAYGGVVAAPVFRNIIESTFAYLNVPVQKNGNQIVLAGK